MSVKVSPKYQVVIPENVRKAMDIRPGTLIEVIAKGKTVYLVPVLSSVQLQKELAGKLDQEEIRTKKDRKL